LRPENQTDVVAAPPAENFVHLHVHTEFSLLDGAIRIDPLLARVKEFNMTAVAVTDHGTMHGAFEFYQKACKAGIKPIIGCECYVAPRTMADKTPQDHAGLTHLVLLAESREGYGNLCRLATAAWDGFYHKPRIDKQILRQYSKGLIGMSACLKGEIPRLLAARRREEADAAARFYAGDFRGKQFFSRSPGKRHSRAGSYQRRPAGHEPTAFSSPGGHQ
jgi:DNA polymerase III subunit alpha